MKGQIDGETERHYTVCRKRDTELYRDRVMKRQSDKKTE